MAITKNVAFRGPYIGRTFQSLTKDLLGRDGYLDGASAADDGIKITLGPYAFVQGGIICREDAGATLAVPTGPQPWFVVASTVDDDPATGVILSATSEVSMLGAAVIVAFKMNGRWANPLGISVAGARAADAADKGPESGLRPIPSLTGDVVSAFNVQRGVAVDSRGERHELGAIAQGLASFVPAPSGVHDRNDYVVLRRRAAGAEIVVAQGSTIAPGARPDLSTPVGTGPAVTRPSMIAKHGGSAVEVAYAWGSATALMLSSMVAVAVVGDGNRTGVINQLAAYTGAAPVANVLFACLRPSDGAVVIVFTEGNQVKVAAFATKDGSVANAAVRIDAQPNTCTNVSTAVDADGALHVVYQHDEGGAAPSQQVYYTKRSIDSGTFGAAAVTPRLVNGVLSTKNDTFPSIGTDRRGYVHIAYATGNGSDVFGQLRYVVFDSNGGALSQTTVAEYGQEVAGGPGVFADASGAVANIRQPKVVVTPHDEVDIFMLVQRSGTGGPDELGLFNPSFTARLGFPIVMLSHLFAPSGAGTDTLAACAATADELGQLLVFAAWATAGIVYARLDTVLAPHGRLADSYLEAPSVSVTPVGSLTSDLTVARGAAGDVMLGYVDGTNVQLVQWPARIAGQTCTPHPDDVLLSGWQVDTTDSPGAPDAALHETKYQVFNVRPKKMSYPVLVGDDGDYQGYGALLDALAVANRKGGHVVLRGGNHRPTAPLVLGSGVRLEGEGHAVLDFQGARTAAAWLQLGQVSALMTCTLLAEVVTASGGPPFRGLVRPGDLCEFFDASAASLGLFRVRHLLDDTRFAIDGDAPAAVATVLVYACGVELCNVTVSAEGAGTADLTASFLSARTLYGGRIERVKLAGVLNGAGAGLHLSFCRETTVRNVDTLGLQGAVGTFGIWLDRGRDNSIERALIGSADGTGLRVEITEQNPRLIDCGSSSTTPARIVLDSTRTTPAYMVGCSAKVDQDVAHAVTTVGKMLSSVSGGSAPAGAMQFQDENTLLYQAAVPLDLTAPSAAGAAFNGATPRVVVQSVNERLLRAGDTMTGELGLPSLLLSEWSTLPATPPAGQVRLFLQSNGLPAGATPPQRRSQLVLLMSSGETLILAQTDPV